MNRRIVVLLPCYNEVSTVAKVIEDFRRELPTAEIYVYDNNSTDGSGEAATAAGAIVRKAPQQGKSNTVRQMFQEIEADCYIMADADDTYPADEVKMLVEPVLSGEADMVIGDRLSSTYFQENRRPFHNFGNQLVRSLIRKLFHCKINDIMTGYRVFSRRFVKTCPILTNGFELETEMTLFMLDRRLRYREIPVQYKNRPEGSFSKLNTFQDGFRVLRTIFRLLKAYRPLLFFGWFGMILLLASGLFFIPVFSEYWKTGQVARFPTLICCIGCMAVGFAFIGCGLILESVKGYFDRVFELNLGTYSARE